MRVILDCNIIVSAALRSQTCVRVIECALDDHTVLLTADILSEYRRVAGYKKFSAQMRTQMQVIIERIVDDAETVATTVALSGIEAMADEGDVIYVVAAHAGQADLLVTGNHRDFTAAAYGGARVVSASEFLILVGAG
jgi:putative PIN family toxin of toxin-antitoxin system